jgi:hypothetical protein
MYPAQRGRVIVQDRGNFYAEGEVLHPDPEQLPQFFHGLNGPKTLPKADSIGLEGSTSTGLGSVEMRLSPIKLLSGTE